MAGGGIAPPDSNPKSEAVTAAAKAAFCFPGPENDVAYWHKTSIAQPP